MTAIMSMKGNNGNYVETFQSPFGKPTREDALRVLEDIRNVHDAVHGWKEIFGYAEQREDDLWYAVRKHEKVS